MRQVERANLVHYHSFAELVEDVEVALALGLRWNARLFKEVVADAAAARVAMTIKQNLDVLR